MEAWLGMEAQGHEVLASHACMTTSHDHINMCNKPGSLCRCCAGVLRLSPGNDPPAAHYHPLLGSMVSILFQRHTCQPI